MSAGWPSAVLFAVLGLAVGSFLNVCIDRLPRGGSLLRPASHCDKCGYRLMPADMVPLFSYIWLRGRCRICGAAIPCRVPVVEGVTGLTFLFLWWHYGPNVQLPLSLLYSALLLVIFFIDLEHGLVLNVIVYPAIVLALALSPLWPGLGLVRALEGAALGFVLILLPYLVYRGGMGAGDVKLAAFMGLVAGFPQVVVAFLLAVVGGGVVAALLLITRLKGRKAAIPFAPFMAAAIWVTMLWGRPLLDWYLGLFPR